VTKPVPDRAEAAAEFPFEQAARFDAHFDDTGVSLSVERPGVDYEYKPVRMHFHYALFTEILLDLAKTAGSLPAGELEQRNALRNAARTLALALGGGDANDVANLTPEEEVRLLHVLE